MPTYIKTTFSLTSNKNSVTSAKGPLSIALALSKSASLSVDDVRSRVVTVGTAGTKLFDGDQISGGDGAAGTVGSFIYFANTSASSTTNEIYIGIDHDGSGDAQELEADNQVDALEAATRIMTLKPGEFAFFPFDYTVDIFVDANAASQTLEYWLFDRGA
tara:strand:+ start:121 stop:600 length:480 start_codon:yes stop_codon:yes gene_type:complete